MRTTLDKRHCPLHLSFFVLSLLSILFLSGCASTPRVSTQAAPDANLPSFKTFGFYSPLGTDKGNYGSLLSQKLKTATRTALESKGLTYKEQDADLLVNFNITTTQKTDVNTMPTGYGYGWRGGYYSPWVGYNNVSVHQYTEGELVVDLIDQTQKKMVWEGTATAIVNNDPQKNAEKINRAITEMFREFPAPQ